MFIRLPISGVVGIVFLMAGRGKRRSARRAMAAISLSQPLDLALQSASESLFEGVSSAA